MFFTPPYEYAPFGSFDKRHCMRKTDEEEDESPDLGVKALLIPSSGIGVVRWDIEDRGEKAKENCFLTFSLLDACPPVYDLVPEDGKRTAIIIAVDTPKAPTK